LDVSGNEAALTAFPPFAARRHIDVTFSAIAFGGTRQSARIVAEALRRIHWQASVGRPSTLQAPRSADWGRRCLGFARPSSA